MTPPGLVYFPDSEPGITRRRRGRGFSYHDPAGGLIRDPQVRDRLASLAVPPAYRDVWMCPDPMGHLQATGRDAKGRKQYLYHPDWTAQRNLMKFDSLVDFGHALPRIRARIARDLQSGPGSRDYALAAAVTLIDRAAIRVGNAQYADENGSYGALSLRDRHLRLCDNHIDLRYTAKGGQKIRRRFSDAKLARILHDVNDLPGATLLTWLDDAGQPQRLTSEALNGYIGETANLGDATAKTFRTWAGTVAAFNVALQGGASIKDMAQAAADRLKNTATIARQSYIHPAVIELADRPAPKVAPDQRNGLRVTEQRLLGFLANG